MPSNLSLNNPILISFIIPTYNSEKFLSDTLHSIINQHYEHIEIIIVDGKSTDQTLNIVHEFDRYIETIISEEDDGIYDAINKGINASSGDIIKILNSDDVLSDDAISETLPIITNLFDKGERFFTIMSKLNRIDLEGNLLKTWNINPRIGLFENWNHPTWFTSKQVYDEIGLYSLEYKIASDYEFHLRQVSSKIKIIRHNKPLSSMREGGVSDNYSGISEVIKIKTKYHGVLLSTLLKWQLISFKLLVHLRNKLLR